MENDVLGNGYADPADAAQIMAANVKCEPFLGGLPNHYLREAG